MQLDSGPVSSPQPVVEPGQEPLIPHIYLAEARYFWLDSLFVQRRSHAHSRLGLFLFQMKKEEKRRRKSRSFCSAHPWFTQSRQHWSSFNHIVSPPLLVFSVSCRSFWNYKLWKRIWVHAASNIVPLASSPVQAVCLSISLTCIHFCCTTRPKLCTIMLVSQWKPYESILVNILSITRASGLCNFHVPECIMGSIVGNCPIVLRLGPCSWH